MRRIAPGAWATEPDQRLPPHTICAWRREGRPRRCTVQTVVIPVKRLRRGPDALPLPRYMTAGAAGMDLLADVPAPVELVPGARALIGTGIAVEIPPHYEVQVRPRSGLASRHGVTVLNAPGTIDADYRGEIMVLLVNLGEHPYVVRRGDRIAQMVVAAVAHAEWRESDALAGSERGSGGLGHSDVP
ncbi:MAG: dUTP diphosphatase [Candidatus Binatia bacterium]